MYTALGRNAERRENFRRVKYYKLTFLKLLRLSAFRSRGVHSFHNVFQRLSTSFRKTYNFSVGNSNINKQAHFYVHMSANSGCPDTHTQVFVRTHGPKGR